MQKGWRTCLGEDYLMKEMSLYAVPEKQQKLSSFYLSFFEELKYLNWS